MATTLRTRLNPLTKYVRGSAHDLLARLAHLPARTCVNLQTEELSGAEPYAATLSFAELDQEPIDLASSAYQGKNKIFIGALVDELRYEVAEPRSYQQHFVYDQEGFRNEYKPFELAALRRALRAVTKRRVEDEEPAAKITEATMYKNLKAHFKRLVAEADGDFGEVDITLHIHADVDLDNSYLPEDYQDQDLIYKNFYISDEDGDLITVCEEEHVIGVGMEVSEHGVYGTCTLKELVGMDLEYFLLA